MLFHALLNQGWKWNKYADSYKEKTSGLTRLEVIMFTTSCLLGSRSFYDSKELTALYRVEVIIKASICGSRRA